MKTSRPGVLATRAVNQYRRRDVVGYLGTRYLLKSVVAQSDRWAQEVATELVVRRASPAYFISHHFKGESGDGSFVSREIAIPSPIEVLAETALLAECARHGVFKNPDSVYTYELASPWDRSGSFVNYFDGLKRRQRAIAARCQTSSASEVVRYVDIKRFYPSIRSIDAHRAWAAASAVLPSNFIELGVRLLSDHKDAADQSSRGILTGPMFSHLVANLVMRDIDDWAARSLGVAYYRYVDDITLVGMESDVRRAERLIAEKLAGLELELHGEESEKSITIGAKDWLLGRNDFEDDADDVSWKRLVGDLKTFLLVNPSRSKELHRAFVDVGMRIPVPDYDAVAFERMHAESFLSKAQRAWFRLRARQISTGSLIQAALELKRKFEDELAPILTDISKSTGYQQKRLVPRARFRAGRLVYLAETDSLEELAAETQKSPELRLHAEVMEAAASGDVSRVLAMGANAVQAAAQPLRAGDQRVRYRNPVVSDVELQGLAILNFNGLEVRWGGRGSTASQSEALYRISIDAVGEDLMRASDPYIREVSCLAGLGADDHSTLLEQAFDEADEVILDAVDRLEESVPVGG